jgi:hypothetical protein
MDRFRDLLGVGPDPTDADVKAEMRTDISAHRSRLKVIDAIVEARTPRTDRRRVMVPAHPNRRAGDR